MTFSWHGGRLGTVAGGLQFPVQFPLVNVSSSSGVHHSLPDPPICVITLGTWRKIYLLLDAFPTQHRPVGFDALDGLLISYTFCERGGVSATGYWVE